jgi:antitoxin (DNA-binding transcriptional repressor) of toxin-antitoxin stability system
MRQLPIEQNDRTASVMAYAEHGETVEVTRQGRVIGRISPATGGELDDLIAAGRVVPATNRGPIPMPEGEIDHTSAATNALIAMREEERW